MKTIKLPFLALFLFICQNYTAASSNESNNWEFKTTNKITIKASSDVISALNNLTKALDWKTTCYIDANCTDGQPIEYTYRFYFEITEKEKYLYIRTSKKACTGSYDERNEYRILLSSLITDNIEFDNSEDRLSKIPVYRITLKSKFNSDVFDLIGEEREKNKDAKLIRTKTDSLNKIEFCFNDKNTALRVLDSFKKITSAFPK